jgi:hypoxanthine phosphoribosyltransferase
MVHDIARVLVDRERISARVREMGARIAADVDASLGVGGNQDGLVIIPIMTGALVFTADLIRSMPVRLSIRLFAVSSYPGTSMQSKGVTIASELPGDLAGKHVLVIDDILDTGNTLAVVRELIERQNPASVRICVLLRKPDNCRKTDVKVEYVGFDIPDAFVVGYGLDFDGFYRNYPDIGVLKR